MPIAAQKTPNPPAPAPDDQLSRSAPPISAPNEPNEPSEPDEPDEPGPAPRAVAAVAARGAPKDEPVSSLPSCESAAASANQSIDLGAGRGAPDLTRDAFASVLDHGAYLDGCAIPARTSLQICAAVQNGRVVGVSVTAEPRDAGISACVRRAVGALRFPQNARLDVTRTRFEASR